MTTDRESWIVISRHFDRLCDLSPPERRREIGALELTPDQLDLLQRLLAAHDDPAGPMDEIDLGSLAHLEFGADGSRDWTDHRFGRWRAGKRIARGGMSVVYDGFRDDGQFDKRVAIKILDAGLLDSHGRERLRDEIRILARLEHPGIARLIDSGSLDEGNPYLVMEYVNGEPVDRYCAARNLDVRTRVGLIIEAAEALDYAHQRRIIHCDVKPANVLVNTAGRVRVVDFGIAHLLDAGADEAEPQVFCSPAYAAPERLQGASPTTAQDVFSLGALLYRLLAGRGIRSGTTAPAGLSGTVHSGDTTIVPPSSILGTGPAGNEEDARPIRAGTLRGDLDAICTRALAEHPDDRYPTVAALRDDLRAWLDRRPVAARNGNRLYHLGRWARRHAVSASLGLMLVLALVTGAAVALWQADAARTEAARATAVRDFMIDIFEGSNPARSRGEDPPASELLRRGAERVRVELAGQPRLLGELLHIIGNTQLERGLIDGAVTSLDRAVELLARHGDASRLALALSDRGMAAYEQGDIDASLGWHERARETSARVQPGTRDDHLIRTRLADILVVDYRAEPALEITAPLLAELDHTGASPAASLVYALRVHGAALQIKGEHAAAERHLADALARQLDLEPDDVFTAKIRNDLGIVYWESGRFGRAAEMFTLSLEQKRRVYGSHHPQTIAALGNLAGIRLAEGRHDLAAGQFEDSLEALRAVHGHGDHPEIAYTLGMLAWTRYNMSDPVAAARHAERAHAMVMRLDAADDPFLDWIGPLRGLLALEAGADQRAREWLAVLPRDCRDFDATTALTRLLCLAHALVRTDRREGCNGLSPPNASISTLVSLPVDWRRAYRLIAGRCGWSVPAALEADTVNGMRGPEWLVSRLAPPDSDRATVGGISR